MIFIRRMLVLGWRPGRLVLYWYPVYADERQRQTTSRATRHPQNTEMLYHSTDGYTFKSTCIYNNISRKKLHHTCVDVELLNEHTHDKNEGKFDGKCLK